MELDRLQHAETERAAFLHRLLVAGDESLTDAELLEQVLDGTPHARPLACRLLLAFGSFARVIHADASALLAVEGIRPAILDRLTILRLAMRRALRAEMQSKPVIAGATGLSDYLSFTMAHRPVEEFRVLYLDPAHALLADEVLWRGTINHTPVYLREIVKRALEIGAAALIVAHNHPCGDLRPSPADIAVTTRIVEAVATMDIAVHDHVIVGPTGYFSFRAAGLFGDESETGSPRHAASITEPAMTGERTEPEIQAHIRQKAAELLGRARGQHSELEQAAGRAEGPASMRLAAIIASLRGTEIQLEQAIDSPGASRADLATLEMLLRGTELAAGDAVQAASAGASGKEGGDIASITNGTRQEIRDLSRDIFERRIFDPYLHFGSPEEERSYREREAERQRQIAELEATGRPGDALVAGGLVAGQMLDAGGHGATNSPDFLPRWNRLVDRLQQQRAAIVARGQDPHALEQFDRQVREDVRAYLQRRGLPADQIERVLASPDPLRAATPYLTRTTARELEASVSRSLEEAAPAPWQGEARAPTRVAEGTAPSSATPEPARIPAMARATVNMVRIDFLTDSPAPLEGGHGLPDQARLATAPTNGRTAS